MEKLDKTKGYLIEYHCGRINVKEIGYKMSFDDNTIKYLSRATLINLDALNLLLYIKWHTIYFILKDQGYEMNSGIRKDIIAWSILVVGSKGDETFQFWRKEFASKGAGTTTLYFEGRNPRKVSYFLDGEIFDGEKYKNSNYIFGKSSIRNNEWLKWSRQITGKDL